MIFVTLKCYFLNNLKMYLVLFLISGTLFLNLSLMFIQFQYFVVLLSISTLKEEA